MEVSFPFKKELWTTSLICIESYRVFTGATLVFFVPGVCDGRQCTPYQNFTQGSTAFKVACLLNVLTLISFATLYCVEIRREYRLSKYLLISPTLPTDSLLVGKAMEKLKAEKKINLQNLTRMYELFAMGTLLMFLVNTVASGYVIYTEYANGQAPMMVVTNTVLLGGKLFDIYTIARAKKNVYFSAYNKQHVQYNDANPAKCDPQLVIEEGQ